MTQNNMCGFIFQTDSNKINKKKFRKALNAISWRGPDAQKIISMEGGSLYIGHCRLSVIDPVERSNQPMKSSCDRFTIAFNGEIYNHIKIRELLNLTCKTLSDTETIIEGYISIGNDIFKMLDGMFSVVIYDNLLKKWVASRDSFGIKPLYISKKTNGVVIASEPASIAMLVNAKHCKKSLNEWRIIRRPMPGKSFFEGVDEVMPGSVIDSNGHVEYHWKWEESDEIFKQDRFEGLLRESEKSHELSDVENVALLSGGLDSAIIASLSKVKKFYTVGLADNNEFDGAQDTANETARNLVKVTVTTQQLIDAWKKLTLMRGEPLSLPNEGLIYMVCQQMNTNEKVVLTGEGADELLFGYDGIYRWALSQEKISAKGFLLRYGYSDSVKSSRLVDYIEQLKRGKSPIEFVEDFFFQVHLPGLLRRMDFSSMAASKEARVPFVSKKLISYMYRKSPKIKINLKNSKLPVREFAKNLELFSALNRKKIGFSAQVVKSDSRIKSYQHFQNIVLDTLNWR